MAMSVNKLVQVYMENIMRLYGIHISIVSDRDARFTARIWKEFQETMGIELKFSTIFHLRKDG